MQSYILRTCLHPRLRYKWNHDSVSLFDNHMWLYIILTLLALWLGRFYYNSVYKTKKEMARYREEFAKAGYRVKAQGFKLFLSEMVTEMRDGEKNHNNPFYFFEQKHPSYDVVVSSMLNKPSIVLINPDLIQQFFANDTQYYKKLDIVVEGVERVLGRGIFFSEDEAWKKKRKILSAAFHYSWIKDLTPRILTTADSVFNKFESKHAAENPLKMVLLQEFQKIFSSVMLKFFFGYVGEDKLLDGEEPSQFVNKLMMQTREQTVSPWFLLFGAKFFNWGLRKLDRDVNRKIEIFKQFALDIVGSRVKELKEKKFKREDKASGDLLEELYLSKALDNDKSEDNFDHLELVEEFCGFFLAGTETTALLVTMTIIYLTQHPAVKSKLEAEVAQFIRSDEDYSDENLQKLQYMTACLNETLRYYGPANSILMRQVTKNHNLKGVNIMEGTLINPVFIGNHFNSAYFKDPYEWNPERWLGENKTMSNSHVFLPFSSGKRNCIGKYLAMTEAKIALARFIQRYQFEINEEIKMRMVFMVAPLTFNTLLTKK